MSPNDIQRFIKRYKYIKQLLKSGKQECSFYVGNRKRTVVKTRELEMVYQAVEDVYANIKEGWKKGLIGEILKGESDECVRQRYPCGKNLYREVKRGFIEAVYRCCIAKQMVTYEELIEIGISK